MAQVRIPATLMMLRHTATIALTASLLTAIPAVAQTGDSDWPGFRGPRGDGQAPDTSPPTRWSDDENLAWKAELPGAGYSSPIVVGDRVLVTSFSGFAADEDNWGEHGDLVQHLSCFDRASGEQLWDRAIPNPLAREPRRIQISEHGFATPTPVSDGERVYLYVGGKGAMAFGLDGEELWSVSLGERELDPQEKAALRGEQPSRDDGPLLRWGAALSPVLYGDLVIINASEESNSLRALNKATGELVWERETFKLAGNASSPAVYRTPEDRDILVFNLAEELWVLDPTSGETLWSLPSGGRQTGMAPVTVADGERFYTFGGATDSRAMLLTAEASDDLEASHVLWTSSNTGIPSPVLHEGVLMVPRQNGTALSIDSASGEVLFEGRMPKVRGKVYAPPVVAGSLLYITSRERGVFVYTADGQFELLANNQFASDDSNCNAAPAVAGDQLFLRSQRYLYCVAERD